MLMEARKSFLSIKYSLMRETLNKTTFLSNIIFMILNNATFIIEWLVFFSLKSSFGGYTLNKVLLLWALAAGSYGISHFFFKDAYNLSDIINEGALDSYLLLPRNTLISSITGNVDVSAIGDIIYSLIVLALSKPSFLEIILFILFSITGALIVTSIAVIFSSLAFWIQKSDAICDVMTNLIVCFDTYPKSIFKGITKVILYTIVPVGISAYIPMDIIIKFDLKLFLIVIIYTILITIFAFYIFNKGLKRYSSSSLMNAKI